MDWDNLLYTLAIVLAVAGGISSLAGWKMRKKEPAPESTRPAPAHILTMLAYILMSLSIFFVALRGLLSPP